MGQMDLWPDIAGLFLYSKEKRKKEFEREGLKEQGIVPGFWETALSKRGSLEECEHLGLGTEESLTDLTFFSRYKASGWIRDMSQRALGPGILSRRDSSSLPE